MADTVRCQCGIVTDTQCEWVGPLADTVVVEWMPECHRQSHRVAGNMGRWPLNGAVRFRTSRECAEMIAADEGEWAEILGQDAIVLEEEGEEADDANV